MSQARKKKAEYIQCRISAESKKTIEAGAMLCGLDVSDYIRTNMLKIAQKDVSRASLDTTISLNQKEWDNIVKIMEKPFVPNEKLKSAFDKLREIEENG